MSAQAYEFCCPNCLKNLTWTPSQKALEWGAADEGMCPECEYLLQVRIDGDSVEKQTLVKMTPPDMVFKCASEGRGAKADGTEPADCTPAPPSRVSAFNEAAREYNDLENKLTLIRAEIRDAQRQLDLYADRLRHLNWRIRRQAEWTPAEPEK